MKKIATFSLFILIFISACKRNEPPKILIKPETTATIDEDARSVAEYEPMEAIWLLWPNMNHKQGYQNSSVTLQLIQTIAPFANIKLLVPNDSVFMYVRHQLPDSLTNTKRLEVLTLPYQEFWARDMGPLFTKRVDGGLQVADFNFNAWSYGETTDANVEKDEKLDEKIAEKLNMPYRSSTMIHEGGDHEINSKGTLICVESVEMMRNPTMSKLEMEAEFKQILGAKKVIWLKKGVFEDDNTQNGTLVDQFGKAYYTLLTTNGHIDEFCRWVNDSTVLLAQVPRSDLKNPIEKENKRRMDENYNILRQATDQDGKKINILRMPTPKLMYSTMKPGDVVYDIISDMDFRDKTKFPKEKTVNVIAAASYLNFLIVNDLVVAQKYWKPGLSLEIQQRDALALGILQKSFPNKKIVMIDAFSVNLGGGGVHCITMNQPK